MIRAVTSSWPLPKTETTDEDNFFILLKVLPINLA